MLDFIRKKVVWDLWDKKIDADLPEQNGFHLKAIQDLVVYAYLRDMSGRSIAEIGGGDSRILRALAKNNSCYNIDKFEGTDGGPKKAVNIEGVRNVIAFLGEFSPDLPDRGFDVVFSVSVLEHVPYDRLHDFVEDGMRILKPGGLWLHAIDFYLEDDSTFDREDRFQAYYGMVNSPRLGSLGNVHAGPVCFACDMATHPDDGMYRRGRLAPSLNALRQRSQAVSLLMAYRRLEA